MILDKSFTAICSIADKDDSRPVLMGVKLEKDRAVATDGFRLMVMEYPPVDPTTLPIEGRSLNEEEIILPAKDLKVALTQIKKKRVDPQLQRAWVESEKDGYVKVASTSGDTFNENLMKKVEGTFPDYQKILDGAQEKEVKASITVNARLMSDTLRAMADALKELEFGSTVTIEVREGTDPILIRGSSETRKIEALVMPVRL